MDENHQDKTGSKLSTTEDELWLPPLSPKEQKKVDQFQKKPFVERMGLKGKTLWDWLNLLAALAIPLVVVGATIGFGWWQGQLADKQHANDQTIAKQQHDADQQRALDQQQATILQIYLDNIQDLMLKHNLRKSNPDDDVARLARARSLTALQGLDPERKGRLLIFLHEAKLIGFKDINGKIYDPIIILSSADLSGAHLSGADLSGADLSGADLSGADLSKADLSKADLPKADLSRANLREATLYQALLYQADLIYADLSKADLYQASLYQASLYRAIFYHADLAFADLSKADLTGAILTGAKRSPTAKITSFVGTWQNVDPDTGSWIRIEITAQGNTLAAHFFGQCYPTPCDAGSTYASFEGNPVHLYMDSGFAVENFTLILVGDTLHVNTFIRFTDKSGRPNMIERDDFRR